MARIVPNDRFCAAEVKRRIKHAKEYLQRYKTQRLLFLAPDNHFELPCIYLEGYDCLNEYNYVSSVELSEQLIRDCVKENRELFVDESKFRSFNVIEYVDEYFDALQRFFCLTCFYLLDRENRMTRKIVLCLGSLHHAPRIFYRDDRYRFYFDRLSMYDDLQ